MTETASNFDNAPPLVGESVHPRDGVTHETDRQDSIQFDDCADPVDRAPCSFGEHDAIGGRKLIRRVSDSPFGRRYLALDPRRDVDCLVWLFDGVSTASGPSIWAYLKRAVGTRRPHILSIEAAGRERGGTCWAVTPYIGNHEGVVSLEDLRNARGGMMTIFEAGRAIEQLLDAAANAHRTGLVHGELSADCVLVNPRGTLEIGMYGLGASIEQTGAQEDIASREIRAIGTIGWQLMTGDPQDSTDTGAARSQQGAALRAWIERAIDPVEGFDTLESAIDALPAMQGDVSESRLSSARALLGKLSSVVAARNPRGRVSAERKSGQHEFE